MRPELILGSFFGLLIVMLVLLIDNSTWNKYDRTVRTQNTIVWQHNLLIYQTETWMGDSLQKTRIDSVVDVSVHL